MTANTVEDSIELPEAEVVRHARHTGTGYVDLAPTVEETLSTAISRMRIRGLEVIGVHWEKQTVKFKRDLD
jgi:hypothetical protein